MEYTDLNLIKRATGKEIFIDDINIPDALYGGMVLSEFAPAIIRGINIQKAKKIPGVVSVLLAEQIPGRNRMFEDEMSQPVICSKRVETVGDAVALVAATSRESVQEALAAITVDYKPLNGTYTLDDARSTNKQNIINSRKLLLGNPPEAFANAAVTVEQQYITPFAEHAYLEVEGALAMPSADGHILIYGASQEPMAISQVVASILGISENNVRFKQVAMGGGFGGKAEASFSVCARASLLAWLTGKPVKLILNRKESFQSSTKRHSAILSYKTAADKRGKLTALIADIYLDKGAYTTAGGVSPPAFNRAFYHATGPYHIPNVELNVYEVRTNNPCGGQMRAPGVPQVNFAMESQLDEIAAKLRIDPLNIRIKNILKKGAQTAYGNTVDNIALRAAIQRAAKIYGWKDCPDKSNNGRLARGVGIAVGWHGISNTADKHDCAAAYIYTGENNKLFLRTGLSELGQGLKAAFRQIAAHELDVPLDTIEVCDPDSALDPHSGKTTSSRATTWGGSAVLAAAKDAQIKLLNMASEYFDCSIEELNWKKGVIAYNKSRKISIFDLINQIESCKQGALIGQGIFTGWPKGQGYRVYAYTAQIAEVEVDKETGKVNVLRLVVSCDVGKAIHPQSLEGQITGGSAMGVGYALTEKIILEGGCLKNPSFLDYKIPTALDIPRIEAAIVKSYYPGGPLGAKGAGEVPIVATAAAIANAAYNATGIRFTKLPLLPEEVLRKLKKFDKKE